MATSGSGRRGGGRTLASRLLRLAGWGLVSVGVVALLYVAYSLVLTGVLASRAQAELLEVWERQVPSAPAPGAPTGTPAPVPAGSHAPSAPTVGAPPAPVDPGEPVALIEFARRAGGEAPVREDPLLVVEGVSAAELRSGPGHYPGTALPGEPGNVAVAGHRTTYGAPFFRLDELVVGDEVHVTSRDGVRHVYRVLERRVVDPSAGWVLGPDPLDRGRPLLTLTTCHPRFSAAQRLIVFAELVP